MRLISSISVDELKSCEGLESFSADISSLSKENVSTILDIFKTVLDSGKTSLVKEIRGNDEGFFIFVTGEGESTFDLYRWLNDRYIGETSINCVNANILFPKSLSAGMYLYNPPSDDYFEDDVDGSTTYMDEEDLQELTGAKVPCLLHKKTNTKLEIPTNGLRVGRSKNSDYVIQGNSNVSRLHCNLYRVGDDVFVRDLGSANGTFVDGLVVRKEDVKININGILMVADEEFTVIH